MTLYHYTTIETLALIIKHKTIRFNRLDNVDDLQEIGYTDEGLKLGQFMFVSCWTKSKEENIAQWSMYAKKGHGIRIEIDSDMFEIYPNQNLFMEVAGKELCIAIENIHTPDYLVFPPPINGEINKSLFFRTIEYVENPQEKTKEAFKYDEKNCNIDLDLIGKFKDKCWSFQDEVRFSIAIFPHSDNKEDYDKYDNVIYPSIKQNKPLQFTYYDLKIKDQAIKNMVVRLGPSCKEAEKYIVESLRDRIEGNNIKIEESNLKGFINLK